MKKALIACLFILVVSMVYAEIDPGYLIGSVMSGPAGYHYEVYEVDGPGVPGGYGFLTQQTDPNGHFVSSEMSPGTYDFVCIVYNSIDEEIGRDYAYDVYVPDGGRVKVNFSIL